MRKSIIILLLGAILTSSCQKKDDNGNLGGFWKLLSIEESDGTVKDTKEENIFWAIQLDLLQVRANESLRAYGRFQHIGDSLFVQMIDTPKILSEYGLKDPTDARFGVEHLDRKKMVLQSKYSRLTFRKF